MNYIYWYKTILGNVMIESLSVILRNGEHKSCQKTEYEQMFPFSKHKKNRFQKLNADNKHDIENWKNYRTDEAYNLSTSFQLITRK